MLDHDVLFFSIWKMCHWPEALRNGVHLSSSWVSIWQPQTLCCLLVTLPCSPGVYPVLSTASRPRPESRSLVTTWMWPQLADRWNAVSPYWSLLDSTSAPALWINSPGLCLQPTLQVIWGVQYLSMIRLSNGKIRLKKPIIIILTKQMFFFEFWGVTRGQNCPKMPKNYF